jgi:hypothetical protein
MSAAPEPASGNEGVLVADGESPAQTRPSFWRGLPRMFAYPLRGDGKWMIFGGGVGVCLAQLASMVLGLAGMIIGMFLAGYFAMYALRNIATSANGERDPSGWPDIRTPDDVVSPLLQVFGSLALYLGPVAGYLTYLWVANVPGSATVTYALLAAGVFCLPMGLLSVALRDSLRGLNPLIVLPAIVKVFPAYLVTLLAIGVACAMVYPLSLLFRIPLLGSLVGAMFEVYWLTAVTYVVGLIYHAYEKRLGWFPE